MFSIVICEIKKFKRLWIPLIIGVYVVILISSASVNTSTIKSADDLFTWVNMTVFSYGFLAAINIFTAYVFITEYKNNTMLTMMTYRHERWKIFIGKLIFIALIGLFAFIVEFIMLAVSGFISFKGTLTLAVLEKHFLLTVKAYVFQMLMVTVTACMALASRNIVVPIMYIAFQLAASFMFLCYPTVRAFIPFPLPVVSYLMLIRDNYKIIRDISIMPSTVIIACTMFAAGIIYGCWHVKRMEVL